MNKWQRLHIAVLDAVVDNGPLTADEIVERVDYKLDAHFSAPRVRHAVSILHRAHALIGYEKKMGRKKTDPTLVFYVANTTNPKALRAVWRGESFVVTTPGGDGMLYDPGIAQ